MATVTEDLVNGHRANYYAKGADIVRTFHVSGLVADPWAQLDEALGTPGVPQLYDLYPTPPVTNLTVRNREAFPDGPNAARVVVFYTNDPGPTWEQTPPVADGLDVKQITASVSPFVTTRDEQNNPMTLEPTPGGSAAGIPSYLSEASVQRPVGALVFERTESDPPASRMRNLVGYLNQDVLGSYAARTLLFTRLDAQSDDGGRTWRVTYEFQYRPDGWQHRDTFKLQSGKAPVDQAEVTWNIYGAALFAGLGLDFSDSQSPI